MDLNKVMIIGNLGRDPEIRTFQSGDKIATFSIATTRKWKKDGETQERTEWHNIVARDKNLVDVADRFLQKGTRVYVEGRLETRKWEDKDGNDRYTTEVVLPPFEGRLNVEARGKGWDDAGNGGGNTGDPGPNDGGDDDLDDEIPF